MPVMLPTHYIHRGTIIKAATRNARRDALNDAVTRACDRHAAAVHTLTSLKVEMDLHCDEYGDDDNALNRDDAVERHNLGDRIHTARIRVDIFALDVDHAKQRRTAFIPTPHVIPYVPAKASKVWARGTSPRRQDKAVMRWCLSRIANGVATLTDAEAKRYGVKPGLKVRVCSDGLYTLDIPFDKVAGRCTNLSAAMAKRQRDIAARQVDLFGAKGWVNQRNAAMALSAVL